VTEPTAVLSTEYQSFVLADAPGAPAVGMLNRSASGNLLQRQMQSMSGAEKAHFISSQRELLDHLRSSRDFPDVTEPTAVLSTEYQSFVLADAPGAPAVGIYRFDPGEGLGSTPATPHDTSSARCRFLRAVATISSLRSPAHDVSRTGPHSLGTVYEPLASGGGRDNHWMV
jgi:hypothetical protein